MRDEPKKPIVAKKGQKLGSRAARRLRTLQSKPSFDRTDDIIRNLANTSSTSFNANLFNTAPAEESKSIRKNSFDGMSQKSKDSNLSRTKSLRAAFGINASGAGVF